MPGKDPITQFGDLAALQAHTTEVVKLVTQISDAVKSVPEIALAYKNSSGSADLKKNTEDLVAVNKQLQDSMQKIVAMEAEIQALRTRGAATGKAQTDEQIRASVASRAETKARTDAIKAEGDAYRQLALEYNKAAAEAKRLQAVALKTGLKEDAEAAKLATTAALSMNVALKSIEKSVGDTRRNVGNYKDALRELERQLNATRHSMGVLAGYGDSAGGEMASLRLRANALTQEIARLKEESAMAGHAIGGEGGMLGSLKDFGKELLNQAAMFIGIYQAFEFFKTSITEFVHAQQEASKLNNILHNIGRQDAFDRLTEKADRMADKFKTIKSEDLVGVFDKLIVYGKLTENQINDLTPVIIDFAAQTGQSVEEATSVIIKAMEGNTRGLKEFGINIKKGGSEAENLKKIMTELKPRVEGAAQAFGETTAGEIKKTEVAIDEIKKKIGKELEPVIRTALQLLSQSLQGLETLFSRVAKAYKQMFESDKEIEADLVKEAVEKNKQTNENLGKFYVAGDKFSTQTKEQQAKLIKVYEANAKNSQDILTYLMAKGDKTGVYSNSINEFANQVERWRVAAAEAKRIMDDGVLGVGDDKKGKLDFTDYEEGFRQLREELEKWQAEAKGSLDAYTNEWRALWEKYHEAQQKISDTRDKDLQKVLENEEKEIITVKQGAAIQIKIEEDTEKALRYARDAYEANAAALVEKHRAELAAKQKARDEAELNEAIEHHKRMAKVMSDDADTHFREQVTVAKNNADADPSFGNLKKLAAAERDQKIRNQVKLLQEQKITQAEFDSDMEAANNEYLHKIGDAWARQIEKYGGMAVKAFGLVDGLEKAAAERAINNIQRQIDANNRLKEVETARISNSTLSETQKAAALITLDAKVAANNEALQRKQRDEKIKEAAFDKAKAILQITVSTAKAVAEALPNIPLSIIAAATGAAELAIAVAAPLPKYAAGTEHSKEGWALTDERGPEGYITPRGEAFVGNNQPTMRFLEEGTKIIPHEKLREYHSLQLMPRAQHDRQLERKLDKLNSTMERMEDIGREQVSATRRNKPIPHRETPDASPEFWARIYNACN